jgi:hypothetical protein
MEHRKLLPAIGGRFCTRGYWYAENILLESKISKRISNRGIYSSDPLFYSMLAALMAAGYIGISDDANSGHG